MDIAHYTGTTHDTECVLVPQRGSPDLERAASPVFYERTEFMRHILICVLCLISMASSDARARVWRVPADCPTISAGIESAAAGDTVEIYPGTYSDCSRWAHDPSLPGSRLVCVILKSGVHLRSASGLANSVIVDAAGAGGVLFAAQVNNVTVEGITFRGGSASTVWSGSGGGLYATESLMQFTNCNFEDNASPDHGGGVHASISVMSFSGCRFAGNAASTSGGAVYSTQSVIDFATCSFVDNSVTPVNEVRRGGAVYSDESSITVSHCAFEGNSSYVGGAIAASQSFGISSIANTAFAGNSAAMGGAIALMGYFPTSVSMCTFRENTAHDRGGAIDCQTVGPSAIVISGSSFSGNMAPSGTDGHVWPTANVAALCCSTELWRWANEGTLAVDDNGCFSAQVMDAQNDQGGVLDVSWAKHFRDSEFESNPVVAYEVQREGPTWQTVATVAAARADSYRVAVQTSDILTIAEPPTYSKYRVLARAEDPSISYASLPDSGCSVDNLAPLAPDLILSDTETSRTLVWIEDEISDLDRTCLYREYAPAFEARDPIVCSSSQPWYLEDHLARYYYRARSFDIHGNASAWSNEVIGRWPTPVPTVVTTAMRLYPCQPNPFNPRTTIRFDLPVAGHVRLSVFDVAGRLVRALIDENKAEGSHQAVWDGRDASGREVGSGSYLARLDFGGRVQTVNLGLVR